MKKLIPIVAVSLLSVSFAGASYAADVQGKQKKLIEEKQDVKEAKQELIQESKKEANEQVKDVNKSMLQVSRASKIIGTAVKNANGDSLGDIKRTGTESRKWSSSLCRSFLRWCTRHHCH